MKKSIFYLVLIISSITFLISCKKEVEEKPLYSIREYGKYRFGAAINGKEFVLMWNDIARAVDVKDDTIIGLGRCWNMGAWRDEGLFGSVEHMEIFIKDFSGIGKYILKAEKDSLTSTYKSSAEFSHYGWDYHTDFFTNYRDTGYIECIKYESLKKEFIFKFLCSDNGYKNIKEVEGYLSY